jgi:hypothetical protein
MLNNLFVIQSDNGIYGIYTNLDIAKITLQEICDKQTEDKISQDNTSEDKKDSYQINVYYLVDNEYKLTMTHYTYKSNSFWINDEWMTTPPGYQITIT